MEVVAIYFIFGVVGFISGILLSHGGFRKKYARLGYEAWRLIGALHMEKNLSEWTKYEIKRLEKLLEDE